MMARNDVVPLNDLDRRAPEAGRIRLGIKTGRAMKSIDTFRFTSPYQDLIESLASKYGGTAQPWSDERARIKDQWEVVTTSSEIPVYLPANGLSTWYEKWSGGGCERRCDGVACEVVQMQGDNASLAKTACICVGKGVRECQPYTRLNVVLPELAFRGTWRLETKGWNALHELPGMFDMIRSLDESGRMVQAYLGVEKRSDKQGGRTRHYVVPKLTVGQSPQELQSGEASVASIAPVESPKVLVSTVAISEHNEVSKVLIEYASSLGMDTFDAEDFALACIDQANSDPDRLQTLVNKLENGSLTFGGFNEDRTINWIRH